MSQLFHAAICNQCGGSLNLKTLKCESCAVQHLMDFSKSIPAIASEISDKEYFLGRDRRLDSALLLLLQQAATDQKVEVALALTYDGYGAQIHIHANLPHNGSWLEVGKIYVQEKQYTIRQNESSHFYYDTVYISWQIDLGSIGNRFYNLDRQLLRGENGLINSERLNKVFQKMMKIALKNNQELIDAEQRAIIDASRTPSWFERILGA